jgi:hypothetical protein
MPLFIVPPLVSLTYSVLLLRKSALAESRNSEWLVIISMINIILSVMVWYKWHLSPIDILGVLSSYLRSLLGLGVLNLGVEPPGKLILI